MANDIWSLLISGAIGYVAAVLAPILSERVKYSLFGPKLKVTFEENNKAFVTNTKHGIMDAHYVRVQVLNTGPQNAKQCCAFFVNVEKWNTSTNKFEPTIYCDSLPLAWSALPMQDVYRPLDVPRDIRRFVDILSTEKPEKDYRLKTVMILNRYQSLFREHGKFRYTILVSGDNFKPASTKIVFEWSGDWENFKVSAG